MSKLKLGGVKRLAQDHASGWGRSGCPLGLLEPRVRTLGRSLPPGLRQVENTCPAASCLTCPGGAGPGNLLLSLPRGPEWQGRGWGFLLQPWASCQGRAGVPAPWEDLCPFNRSFLVQDVPGQRAQPGCQAWASPAQGTPHALGLREHPHLRRALVSLPPGAGAPRHPQSRTAGSQARGPHGLLHPS